MCATTRTSLFVFLFPVIIIASVLILRGIRSIILSIGLVLNL